MKNQLIIIWILIICFSETTIAGIGNNLLLNLLNKEPQQPQQQPSATCYEVIHKGGDIHREKFKNNTDSNSADFQADKEIHKINNEDVSCHDKPTWDEKNLTTIYLASYDDQIYKLMNEIQKEGPGHELLINFYLYKNHTFHDIGHFHTDKNILLKIIVKYTHYFCVDDVAKESSWCVDNINLTCPKDLKTKVQIFQEAKDESLLNRSNKTDHSIKTPILLFPNKHNAYEFILPKEKDITFKDIYIDMLKYNNSNGNDKNETMHHIGNNNEKTIINVPNLSSSNGNGSNGSSIDSVKQLTSSARNGQEYINRINQENCIDENRINAESLISDDNNQSNNLMSKLEPLIKEKQRLLETPSHSNLNKSIIDNFTETTNISEVIPKNNFTLFANKDSTVHDKKKINKGTLLESSSNTEVKDVSKIEDLSKYNVKDTHIGIDNNPYMYNSDVFSLTPTSTHQMPNKDTFTDIDNKPYTYNSDLFSFTPTYTYQGPDINHQGTDNNPSINNSNVSFLTPTSSYQKSGEENYTYIDNKPHTHNSNIFSLTPSSTNQRPNNHIHRGISNKPYTYNSNVFSLTPSCTNQKPDRHTHKGIDNKPYTYNSNIFSLTPSPTYQRPDKHTHKGIDKKPFTYNSDVFSWTPSSTNQKPDKQTHKGIDNKPFTYNSDVFSLTPSSTYQSSDKHTHKGIDNKPFTYNSDVFSWTPSSTNQKPDKHTHKGIDNKPYTYNSNIFSLTPSSTYQSSDKHTHKGIDNKPYTYNSDVFSLTPSPTYQRPDKHTHKGIDKKPFTYNSDVFSWTPSSTNQKPDKQTHKGIDNKPFTYNSDVFSLTPSSTYQSSDKHTHKGIDNKPFTYNSDVFSWTPSSTNQKPDKQTHKGIDNKPFTYNSDVFSLTPSSTYQSSDKHTHKGIDNKPYTYKSDVFSLTPSPTYQRPDKHIHKGIDKKPYTYNSDVFSWTSSSTNQKPDKHTFRGIDNKPYTYNSDLFSFTPRYTYQGPDIDTHKGTDNNPPIYNSDVSLLTPLSSYQKSGEENYTDIFSLAPSSTYQRPEKNTHKAIDNKPYTYNNNVFSSTYRRPDKHTHKGISNKPYTYNSDVFSFSPISSYRRPDMPQGEKPSHIGRLGKLNKNQSKPASSVNILKKNLVDMPSTIDKMNQNTAPKPSVEAVTSTTGNILPCNKMDKTIRENYFKIKTNLKEPPIHIHSYKAFSKPYENQDYFSEPQNYVYSNERYKNQNVLGKENDYDLSKNIYGGVNKLNDFDAEKFPVPDLSYIFKPQLKQPNIRKYLVPAVKPDMIFYPSKLYISNKRDNKNPMEEIILQSKEDKITNILREPNVINVPKTTIAPLGKNTIYYETKPTIWPNKYFKSLMPAAKDDVKFNAYEPVTHRLTHDTYYLPDPCTYKNIYTLESNVNPITKIPKLGTNPNISLKLLPENTDKTGIVFDNDDIYLNERFPIQVKEPSNLDIIEKNQYYNANLNKLPTMHQYSNILEPFTNKTNLLPEDQFLTSYTSNKPSFLSKHTHPQFKYDYSYPINNDKQLHVNLKPKMSEIIHPNELVPNLSSNYGLSEFNYKSQPDHICNQQISYETLPKSNKPALIQHRKAFTPINQNKVLLKSQGPLSKYFFPTATDYFPFLSSISPSTPEIAYSKLDSNKQKSYILDTHKQKFESYLNLNDVDNSPITKKILPLPANLKEPLTTPVSIQPNNVPLSEQIGKYSYELTPHNEGIITYHQEPLPSSSILSQPVLTPCTNIQTPTSTATTNASYLPYSISVCGKLNNFAQPDTRTIFLKPISNDRETYQLNLKPLPFYEDKYTYFPNEVPFVSTKNDMLLNLKSHKHEPTCSSIFKPLKTSTDVKPQIYSNDGISINSLKPVSLGSQPSNPFLTPPNIKSYSFPSISTKFTDNSKSPHFITEYKRNKDKMPIIPIESKEIIPPFVKSNGLPMALPTSNQISENFANSKYYPTYSSNAKRLMIGTDIKQHPYITNGISKAGLEPHTLTTQAPYEFLAPDKSLGNVSPKLLSLENYKRFYGFPEIISSKFVENIRPRLLYKNYKNNQDKTPTTTYPMETIPLATTMWNSIPQSASNIMPQDFTTLKTMYTCTDVKQQPYYNQPISTNSFKPYSLTAQPSYNVFTDNNLKNKLSDSLNFETNEKPHVFPNIMTSKVSNDNKKSLLFPNYEVIQANIPTTSIFSKEYRPILPSIATSNTLSTNNIMPHNFINPTYYPPSSTMKPLTSSTDVKEISTNYKTNKMPLTVSNIMPKNVNIPKLYPAYSPVVKPSKMSTDATQLPYIDKTIATNGLKPYISNTQPSYKFLPSDNNPENMSLNSFNFKTYGISGFPNLVSPKAANNNKKPLLFPNYDLIQTKTPTTSLYSKGTTTLFTTPEIYPTYSSIVKPWKTSTYSKQPYIDKAGFTNGLKPGTLKAQASYKFLTPNKNMEKMAPYLLNFNSNDISYSFPNIIKPPKNAKNYKKSLLLPNYEIIQATPPTATICTKAATAIPKPISSEVPLSTIKIPLDFVTPKNYLTSSIVKPSKMSTDVNQQLYIDKTICTNGLQPDTLNVQPRYKFLTPDKNMNTMSPHADDYKKSLLFPKYKIIHSTTPTTTTYSKGASPSIHRIPKSYPTYSSFKKSPMTNLYDEVPTAISTPVSNGVPLSINIMPPTFITPEYYSTLPTVMEPFKNDLKSDTFTSQPIYQIKSSKKTSENITPNILNFKNNERFSLPRVTSSVNHIRPTLDKNNKRVQADTPTISVNLNKPIPQSTSFEFLIKNNGKLQHVSSSLPIQNFIPTHFNPVSTTKVSLVDSILEPQKITQFTPKINFTSTFPLYSYSLDKLPLQSQITWYPPREPHIALPSHYIDLPHRPSQKTNPALFVHKELPINRGGFYKTNQFIKTKSPLTFEQIENLDLIHTSPSINQTWQAAPTWIRRNYPSQFNTWPFSSPQDYYYSIGPNTTNTKTKSVSPGIFNVHPSSPIQVLDTFKPASLNKASIPTGIISNPTFFSRPIDLLTKPTVVSNLQSNQFYSPQVVGTPLSQTFGSNLPILSSYVNMSPKKLSANVFRDISPVGNNLGFQGYATNIKPTPSLQSSMNYGNLFPTNTYTGTKAYLEGEQKMISPLPPSTPLVINSKPLSFKLAVPNLPIANSPKWGITQIPSAITKNEDYLPVYSHVSPINADTVSTESSFSPPTTMPSFVTKYSTLPQMISKDSLHLQNPIPMSPFKYEAYISPGYLTSKMQHNQPLNKFSYTKSSTPLTANYHQNNEETAPEIEKILQLAPNALNQPYLGTTSSFKSVKQPINTFMNQINNNLYKYIKQSDVLNKILNEKAVTIPLHDIGVVKFEPTQLDKVFYLRTDNPDIYLKVWPSGIKIIKAKLVIEDDELSALNFAPVVRKVNNVRGVENIVKEFVTKSYGEPIIVKGVYNSQKPYAVIDNINENTLNNDIVYIIWPTMCNCGCNWVGCQCLQK